MGAGLLALALALPALTPSPIRVLAQPATPQPVYRFKLTYIGKGRYRHDTHYVCTNPNPCVGNNAIDHFQATFTWKVSFAGLVAPYTSMTFLGATVGGSWTETGQTMDAATARQTDSLYISYACDGRIKGADRIIGVDGTNALAHEPTILLTVQAPDVEAGGTCKHGTQATDPYWANGMRGTPEPNTLTAYFDLPQLAWRQGKIIQLVNPRPDQLPPSDCSPPYSSGAPDRTTCSQSLSWRGTVTLVAIRGNHVVQPTSNSFGINATYPADGATNVPPATPIRVTFSAPPAGVSIILVPVNGSGAVLVTSQTYDPGSKTLTAHLPAPLRPHTRYRLTITATGQNATGSGPAVKTVSFTTGA